MEKLIEYKTRIDIDKLSEGKKVFDIEIEALKRTRDALDDVFVEILENITSCRGKVIITGMGKPGHIAEKIAATLSSLGTPSFCLHPGEAMHGDLGMITDNDLVIAISYSGESDEIIRILPNIKMFGTKIIGITGNENSTLGRLADIVQVLPEFEEACYLGLAPTSSTTAALCYGDALAVVASGVYGFKSSDFGKLHPAGALGKKLILKVEDLMVHDENVPLIKEDNLLMNAITEMSQKCLGVVCVVDSNNKLKGIITDGDLRRMIENQVDIYKVRVEDIMIHNPKTITKDRMAINALKFIKENNINCLPVVDNDFKLIGTITLQMIVKAGIII